METPLDPLEELALSNMWSIVALVEVLERKGLLTRDEIRETMRALQERHPERADVGHRAGERPGDGKERRRRVTWTRFPRI